MTDAARSDGVVIDASATLAWLFGETKPSRKEVKVLQEYRLIAPSLWKIEVANAILVNERRKKITEAQGMRYLSILESLAIEIMLPAANQNVEQLAAFARPHQLTAYDAVYLELAVVTGLPLYTRDRNLQQAAKRMGIDRTI